VKYFESIEDAKTKLNLKPMTAQKYKERLAMGKIVFPVSVQPKLNGYRLFMFRREGRVVDMSRGGILYGMQHLIDELEPVMPPGDLELILDGEVYFHGMSFQRLGSLVKKPRYPETGQLEMHVYDVTSAVGDHMGLAWEQREPWLIGLHMGGLAPLPHFKPVDCVVANSDHEVQVLHDAFVADGYEGAIIRMVDHTYRFGYRSPGLLKLKNFKDKEFPIVGWVVGKDSVPMWVVKLENGETMPVRPEGTDEERAEMLQNADAQVGKLLKVKYQDRTDKGLLVFAVGVEIRDEADL
jgi:ATP-dependent DNA ligase